ncbi:MAG: hypothetical protein N2036_10115 [Bryobacteraceae bacterium]|nr:hypothetical protein [Bryobacteraceae bacterium]MCX7604416.1 hypothetical protein [Bryobacteraceae bacterium]
MTVPRRIFLVALLAALAAAASLLWLWLPLRRADARSLLAELPPGEGLTVFVDARALRQTGLLQRIAGEAGAEDEEYRKFVEATGFEYRRDLDAVVLRAENGRRWIVAEARLDEDRLRRYFLAHGGRCFSGLCSMQGSAPERQISWVRLKRGRWGIAVSPDPLAAAAFTDERPKQGLTGWQPPEAPLWLYAPAAMLEAPEGAPAWVSLALASLRESKWMIWSAGARSGRIEVALDAACGAPEEAAALAARWEEILKALREAAAAARDKDSLPALLAQGQIRTDGAFVRGRWVLEWPRLERLFR